MLKFKKKNFQICYEFDEEIYKKLQSAYFLLGKTQTAMDQLHMHFTSAVHNTAFNVVLSFVECSSPSGAKMQYAQLCKVNVSILIYRTYKNKNIFHNYSICFLLLLKTKKHI